MPTIKYTVDDEPQSTDEGPDALPEILSNAGIDAASHYLVQIEGAHRVLGTKENPTSRSTCMSR